METDGIDRESFGGVAGRVLRAVISAESFFIGLVYVIGSLALMYALLQKSAGDVGPFLLQIGLAFLLARSAVSGLRGDTGEGAPLPDGTELRESAFVALRYLLLSVLWIVPLAIVARHRGGLPGAGTTSWPFPDPAMLSLSTLVLAAIALMPPVTLIAAVGARRTPQVFSPALWSILFRGRMGDLLVIYVVTVGGAAILALAAAPVVLALTFHGSKLPLVLSGLLASFGIGFGIRLLGKLCGLFARAALLEVEEQPLTLVPGGGTEGTDPASVCQPSPIALASAPAAPEPAPGATEQDVASQDAAPRPPGKPALADARARVDELLAGLDRDPQGTITALEELGDAHAANPVVVAGLCSAFTRAGRSAEALACATEAIPWLLERGNLGPAAAILRDLRGEMHRLGLPAAQLHEIADHAWNTRDVEAAAAIYMQLLVADASDTRAIKRMMQAGEAFLQGARAPDVALGIYRFLVARCAGSPFEDYMRRGLEEAERLRGAAGRRSA